jgi:LemA protein
MVDVWVLIVVPLVIVALFLIITYNTLIARRLRINESWSNVDTELKRRHDLIPNLVEVVRAYAQHERALFENVARLRAQSLAEAKDTEKRLGTERLLAQQLTKLLGVAEAYPRLLANDNFLKLQDQLTETEDRIQAARRFYNANVRDYNNAVQQFPSNIVARWFRFKVHIYFELPNLAERRPPKTTIA